MSMKKHVFTSLEKKCFVEIVKKYSRIIDNKRTDGATTRAKNEAWDNVTRKYNANPYTVEVTCKQLRRLWMNMKQRQREALRNARRHTCANGVPNTLPGVTETPGLIMSREIEIEPMSGLDSLSQSPPDDQPFVVYATSQSTTPPLLEKPPPTVSAQTYTSDSPTTPSGLDMLKNAILEKEFRIRQRRADELHELEKELLMHRIREAKAQAEIAELKLQRLSAGLKF